jgi:hypothetical protein
MKIRGEYMKEENREIDIYKVVKKLIGAIEPVGATHIDEGRFENLKVMTELVISYFIKYIKVYKEGSYK